MAATNNFTVTASAWTRIASGRAEGQVVNVDAGGPFVLAVTVGLASVPPGLPVLMGHRFEVATDIPLVARQHLWACAATPMTLTVT